MKAKRKARRTLTNEEAQGDCAIAHAKLLIDHIVRPGSIEKILDAKPGSVRLCHGLVSTDEVPPHFHCWIEFDRFIGKMDGKDYFLRFAHDRSNGKPDDMALPADLYRHFGRATDVVEYTIDEALQQMRDHGHYGPWVEALLDNPE
jgi:hypothetical protein